MVHTSDNTTLPAGSNKSKELAKSSSTKAKPPSSTKSPTVTPMSSDLLAATQSAEPERLRDSLKALCDRIPGVTELLMELLPAKPSPTVAADKKVAVKKSKKRPRMALCVNCEKEFSPSDNTDDQACVYHSGEMEPDWDCWDAYDEDLEGPIDSPENRVKYPHGFLWSCCNGEPVYDKGCETGVHEEAEDDNKSRVKLGPTAK